MKTTTRSLSTAAALAALLLALVLSACGTKPTAPTGPTAPAAPSAPAQPVWTASSTASAPAPAAQPAGADPQGDADLEQPGQSLDALPGYRQTLEITLRGTLDGSPYEETQRIERQVTGADGALRVTSSATGGQPVSLFDAFNTGFFPSAAHILYEFVLINLVLLLFNLIPLAPLDGEKIADYFFPPSWGRVLDTIRPYGPIILIAIVFVGPYVGLDIIGWIMGPPLRALFGLLVG